MTDMQNDNQIRHDRTAAELDKLEAAEQGGDKKPKKKVVKKKPVEKRSMGQKDTTTIDRNIEGVKEKLRNAGRTKDLNKARDLSSRLAALIQIRNSDA